MEQSRRMQRNYSKNRKRANRLGIYSAPYSYEEVVYGPTHCAICKQPYKPGDKRSLDHIIPLKYGGANIRANVQSAHESCNFSKDKTQQGIQSLFDNLKQHTYLTKPAEERINRNDNKSRPI